MQYVGMDVHWRQTAICILDENGRRVKMMNVRGAWPKVLEELGRLEGPGRCVLRRRAVTAGSTSG